MRREREASAERMAAWNMASVPFKASTRRSIGTWSNTAARAGGGRSARSSKLKSRLLSALASSGRTSARLCRTASDCVLSRRLRMSAMPVREAGAAEATSSLASLASTTPSTSSGTAPDAEHAAQQLGAIVRRERAEGLGRRLRIDPGEDERDSLRVLLDQEGAQHLDLGARDLSQTGSSRSAACSVAACVARLLLGQDAGQQVPDLVGGADEVDAARELLPELLHQRLEVARR